MRVIGIDPGIEKTGFGIVEAGADCTKFRLCDFGYIKTEKTDSLPARLALLARDLKEIIRQWKPHVAGIEQVFFSRNVKTAITVSHARGVIIEVLEEHDIPVFEFNPGQIKSAVTGDTRADKLQVKKMLHYTLGVQVKNDDAADAIACGICTIMASHYTSLPRV